MSETSRETEETRALQMKEQTRAALTVAPAPVLLVLDTCDDDASELSDVCSCGESQPVSPVMSPAYPVQTSVGHSDASFWIGSLFVVFIRGSSSSQQPFQLPITTRRILDLFFFFSAAPVYTRRRPFFSPSHLSFLPCPNSCVHDLVTFLPLVCMHLFLLEKSSSAFPLSSSVVVCLLCFSSTLSASPVSTHLPISKVRLLRLAPPQSSSLVRHKHIS